MPLIIFTGLDGMLLPIEDHDYELITSVVQEFSQRDIPLIPVTNNTRAEVEELSRKIGLSTPFVVEQGSGIFIPQSNNNFTSPETNTVDNYHLYQLGCSYTEARAALKAVQEEISKILRGFGDMDEANIQSLKGLSLAAARRAKAREFSEYFMTPSRLDISTLQEIAIEYGFKILPQGDLSLIMGGKANQKQAIQWLKQNYQAGSDSKITTVGLGSTEQDLALLEAVDIPVVIPTPEGIEPSFAEKNWHSASVTGSLGWVEALTSFSVNQP